MKRPTVGKLKKEADRLYSQYVRRKYADRNGYCSCISCGKVWPWKEIQTGHFVSRRYSNLRYDLRNTKPQCMGCNVFRGGNNANFALGLQREYGKGIVSDLARDSRVLKHFTVPELQKLIARLKTDLKRFTDSSV